MLIIAVEVLFSVRSLISTFANTFLNIKDVSVNIKALRTNINDQGLKINTGKLANHMCCICVCASE